ncbi:MAG: sugar phosphate isomerase/epimerase family protein [Planctomycetota bacterium]
MRIGCCAEPAQASQLAAAGFDFLEANVQRDLQPADATSQRDAAVADLADGALPVESFNCFFPGDMPLLGPSVDERAILDYADRTLRRAARAGASVIVLGSGGARRLPPGMDPAAAAEDFLPLLRGIGDRAGAHGVRVALEPLRRAETDFINTVAAGWDLVRRADHPAIGLLADLYHVGQEDEDLEPLVAADCRLLHVHIADPVTRDAPVVDDPVYRRFFGHLQAMDYDGRISIEARWEDLPRQASAVVAFLRATWERAIAGVSA